MKVKFGYIKMNNKSLYGAGQSTMMYNIIPTIFLGLRDDPVEKDYIIGLDWLLWSAYVQFATPKTI